MSDNANVSAFGEPVAGNGCIRVGCRLGAAPVKAPVAPMMAAAYSWTGFYIGVNAGGGWSSWTGTAGAAGPGIN